MMGSLFSSISGLRNHTTWMNVIGNNISNVNTVGYKQSRITFKEAISQSFSSASGANLRNNLGGINPTQQGLGATLGSIDTIMTQGAIQTTGNATDVAIQGEGFFVVKQGDQTMYTRAGNFYFDNQGNMVTSSGGLVQGWNLQTTVTGTPPVPLNILIPNEVNTNGPVQTINIPQNLVLGPKATGDLNNTPNITDSGIFLKGNLDSNTPINGGPPGPATPPGAGYPAAGYIPDAVNSATVYDSLGNPHVIVFYWTQTANVPLVAPQWEWTAYDTGSNGQLPIPVGGPGPGPGITDAVWVGNSGPITFNADGSLADDGSGALAYAQITLNLTNGANTPQTISVNIGTDNGASPTGIGYRDGVTGDFGGGTIDPTTNAYLPRQTVYTAYADGYSEGTLTGISVDQSGNVQCRFSNNQIISMARIAIARFANPQGLEKAGGTMFVQSANSGLPQIAPAGEAGMGTTTGGALEASNVDLSVELTNMIIAQRGFESNARIVSTSSQMLDTLVNLGR